MRPLHTPSTLTVHDNGDQPTPPKEKKSEPLQDRKGRTTVIVITLNRHLLTLATSFFALKVASELD